MTIHKKQNLLIVDDVPENLFSLESILEDDGREFIKANSGEEALKMLLKHDIDLILLDVQMPGMDGFETAQLIRGAQRTKQIPIIFVTAINKEQKHIFKGYESGAVDYMFKPLEPAIVQSKVSIFLELAKQRRQLEHWNSELIKAKRNTDNILSNVEEGIFLLDKNFKIKPQYSKALEKIFDETALENVNFLALMETRVDKETLESIKDFLELMFQADVDEDNLLQLNPLIEAPITNKKSQPQKYLTLNFKRIYNPQIIELMVTVTDLTASIRLKQQLKKSKDEQKKRYELMNILKLEPVLLREFLQQTEKELKDIEDIIKQKMNETSTELIYRLIHSVKGNAGLLNLSFISQKAHELEEIIIEIKSSKKFASGFNNDFKIKVDEIKNTINNIYKLIEQMKTFYENFNKKSGREGQLMLKAVKDLISRLNIDLEKEAELNADMFDNKLSFGGNFLLIKDILIQLVRNAMVHGIESPLKREQLGKPRISQITLSSYRENGHLIIKLRDDGQGLRLDSIRKKAIESGKWNAKELSEWSNKKIANLIFESGISTKNKASLAAGRGIGMGIVMQKIEEINGTISIDFEEGKYTEFTLLLPVKEE